VLAFSMELAQDGFVKGGLPGVRADALARKFAVAMDNAPFVRNRTC
jgi:hypothetical protein